MQLHAILTTEQRRVLPERLAAAPIALDHDHAHGIARNRLEAEGAAACEHIEARSAAEILAQPVEQRSAHAVRRRAQLDMCWKSQEPAAVPAADDAHLIRRQRYLLSAFRPRPTMTVTRRSMRTCRENAARTSATLTF